MPKNKTMRITGGALVRQRFLLPFEVEEGSVRPTPDRVREAVFSMLGPQMAGKNVLDLFAGSGAHGYEAVSRGAERVRFIEKNPSVLKVIAGNIERLGLKSRCEAELQDATRLIAAPARELYDLIFVDPPYTLKLGADFFLGLAKHLSPDGLVVYRCFKKEEPAIGEEWLIEKDRSYGGTRVFILRRAV